MARQISIQGYQGSFHQMAALEYFGNDISVLPCDTFREVIQLASEKTADAGLMAIENSIAGSILPNYGLLQRSDLIISGEIYLQIHQNLLANKGVKLEDIREVHSHPMALQQCLEYMDPYNWKLVETDDTALSAKHIHQHRSKHIAAIASKLAAEIYELDVLAPRIQSEKDNYTRFLVLERKQKNRVIENADKASVNFQTDHSKGSLARVLTKIAEGDINLSKLQSSPIPSNAWKYSFHADMEFDNVNQFINVIEAIKPLTKQIKIFGIYKKGKTIK
jgi:prephenate dehydratase